MSTQQQNIIHPSRPHLSGLIEIAANRDVITTAEFAKAISGSEQTLRKNHSLTGQAYGIKPVKVGNKLLWPVQAIAYLIGGTTNG